MNYRQPSKSAYIFMFAISIFSTVLNANPNKLQISYGSHSRQKIDFWFAGTKKSPLVIYIHGGSLSTGDKSTTPSDLVEKLLRAGFAVASINYRLIGDCYDVTDKGSLDVAKGPIKCAKEDSYSQIVPYLTSVNDVKRAIQYLRYANNKTGHPLKDQFNSDKIGLIGWSAGSFASNWVGLKWDMKVIGKENSIQGQSTRVQAIAGFIGQTHLDPVLWEKSLPGGIGLDLNSSNEILDIAQYGGFMPTKRVGWNFSHISDLNNSFYKKVIRDLSPVEYLTKNDPPVLMYFNSERQIPKFGSSEWASWAVHHFTQGCALEQKAKSLGIESKVIVRNVSQNFRKKKGNDIAVCFMKKTLKGQKINCSYNDPSAAKDKIPSCSN